MGRDEGWFLGSLRWFNGGIVALELWGKFICEKFDRSSVVFVLMQDIGGLMVKLNLTNITGNRDAEYY